MMGSVARQVQKGLGQVRQSFLGVVARGGSRLLQLTGFADETLQEVELFQQVGFSSHIPENARVVVLPLQGKTSRSIVIATSGGNVVVNVAEGETCIYDQYGHSILLHENGVKIKGDVDVDGSITASKEVSDQKGSMQKIRTTYNTHVHGNSPAPSQPME
ncbi:bacteriophage Mu Gp45 protein [Acinetobacter calcoaceticus]|uniref:Bacteriophage Mu Gp45 protein n=1 Tax=Acinetobacter calcoaceticus TaxID=471 RepID=A0A4R1XDG8_ACICA|nr:bacteriophage Mu Gp45 protein [Acinetobacter calcoaceticus]